MCENVSRSSVGRSLSSAFFIVAGIGATPITESLSPNHPAESADAIPRRKTIIFAGCLGMVYTQLTLSPAAIEFARQLGGNGLHIGFLGAVPTGMLFLQFVSAFVANHLRYRRGLWLAVSVIQRLILVPVALAPLLWPNVDTYVWLILFLAASTLNHGLLHFATPLWMSWMGDYVPRRGLSRFWGDRHLWMQWSGAAALLAAALLMPPTGVSILPAFAALTVVAAVLGVADVLMFAGVPEPPVTAVPDTRLRKVLAEPFRNREFRSFITFMCFWHFAAMVGAPFISLYLLSEVGMSLPQLMLLWVFCWVGGALCSGKIGRLTEAHGHRPILVLCTALKTTNMVALIMVPQNPVTALYILIPVFVVDSILNAGFAIATNGFLLTKSPAGNRTMFIAAGTALAGLVGGITSVFCGATLSLMESGVTAGGRVWSGFHVLFAVSFVLRIASVMLVLRIKEPTARCTRYVVARLVGTTPMRMLRFPVGLFRGASSEDLNPEEDVC